MKLIIDEHVTKYKSYYASICFSYYGGRYLWEDLFQEMYLAFLKVKPEKFEDYHKKDKLRFLGGRIIGFLYSKRGQKKNHTDSCSSVLNETCSLIDVSDYRHPEAFGDESEFIERKQRTKEVIDEPSSPLSKVNLNDLQDVLNDLYAHDPFLYDVFTILQKETINSLSKKAKINRKFLTDSNKRAVEFIRNHKQFVNF
jgi:hypothetical protein